MCSCKRLSSAGSELGGNWETWAAHLVCAAAGAGLNEAGQLIFASGCGNAASADAAEALVGMPFFFFFQFAPEPATGPVPCRLDALAAPLRSALLVLLSLALALSAATAPTAACLLTVLVLVPALGTASSAAESLAPKPSAAAVVCSAESPSRAASASLLLPATATPPRFLLLLLCLAGAKPLSAPFFPASSDVLLSLPAAALEPPAASPALPFRLMPPPILPPPPLAVVSAARSLPPALRLLLPAPSVSSTSAASCHAAAASAAAAAAANFPGVVQPGGAGAALPAAGCSLADACVSFGAARSTACAAGACCRGIGGCFGCDAAFAPWHGAANSLTRQAGGHSSFGGCASSLSASGAAGAASRALLSDVLAAAAAAAGLCASSRFCLAGQDLVDGLQHCLLLRAVAHLLQQKGQDAVSANPRNHDGRQWPKSGQATDMSESQICAWMGCTTVSVRPTVTANITAEARSKRSHLARRRAA